MSLHYLIEPYAFKQRAKASAHDTLYAEWSQVIDHYFQEIDRSDERIYFAERRYIAERLKGDCLPLPVIIPHCVSEIFSVTHPEDRLRGLYLALLVDRFTHIVDDCADEIGQADSNTSTHIDRIHLAVLLHVKLTKTLVSMVGNAELCVSAWQKYLSEAIEGERYLLRHHGAVSPYTKTDFLMLAKRGGAGKIVPWAYAQLTGQSEVLPAVEDGFDAAAIGLQILDDLLDWEDDYSRQIYNWPIVLALSTLNDNADGEKRLIELRKAIYDEKVLHQVLKVSRAHIVKAQRIMYRLGAHALTSLLRELDNEIGDIMRDASGNTSKVEDRVRKGLLPIAAH